MKKSVIIGTIAGLAVGAAAAIAGKRAYDKVSGEIISEMGEQCFDSPDGNHSVTVSCGSSESAKGLTYIRVSATSKTVEDTCKLSFIALKAPAALDAEWTDNDHFTLLVGSGKRKQCCDVSFEEDSILAVYYLKKDC